MLPVLVLESLSDYLYESCTVCELTTETSAPEVLSQLHASMAVERLSSIVSQMTPGKSPVEKM